MSEVDDKLPTSETETPPDGPSEKDEEDAGGEEEDASPHVTRGQAFFRMAVLTVALLAVLEVVVRTAFHFHRKNANTLACQDYPANTCITDFNEKVDYRLLNLYTVDPARTNNEAYDFDAHGFRLDGQKLRFDQPSSFKRIWMFGASTVQGLGARGDETIAAHLNKLLEGDRSQYRVINMGQGGFTSTQELLLLIELLQAGHKPDAIISYGGATEAPFAGDIEKTGVPEWEKRTPKADLLHDVQGAESVGTLLPLTLSRMTKVDDVMRAILRRMHPAPAGYPDSNWDVVARRHFTTLNLIKAAADQHKVPSLFFFQPLLQYEDHYKIRTLSAEEEKYRGKMFPDEYKRREAINADSVADLRKGLGAQFFDIHDVFRGHDGEKLYADPRHPNGAANAIIAARIYKEILAPGQTWK